MHLRRAQRLATQQLGAKTGAKVNTFGHRPDMGVSEANEFLCFARAFCRRDHDRSWIDRGNGVLYPNGVALGGAFHDDIGLVVAYR